MSRLRSSFNLFFFLLIVAGVAASGVRFQPGEWYMSLIKPFWTPPNWVFPPVWSVLYLMIAVAGWKIFAGNNRALKGLWVAQLLFNGLWSWLFFGQHRTGWALLDIAAMLLCIVAIQIYSRKEAPTVFWLMAPYLIWVSYASTLNAAIFILN